ncbi:carbohydrate kinase family protein [Pseudaeromonas sp. ZJS20]|uniref:carbohydrate kinase family protein n=1 Tax=Pseudaeromonas aegiceratis TaxID=3153928 RepID=UPI00390C7AB2
MSAAPILVSGLINIETTLGIDHFPLDYFPVTYAFDRVASTVSGVGYNVAKALHTLGHDVAMASLIGDDFHGQWVRQAMAALGLATEGLLASLPATPASVILYEPGGRRQIHVDLKTIQQSAYDEARFAAQLAGCRLAVMCNINYNRALLPAVQAAGLPIATDVHVLSDPDDAYNRDFMAAADILFLSDEGLHGRAPEELIGALQARYHNPLIVMGQGSQGALMYVAADRQFHRSAARSPRPVVNTIGAGDALFSAFLHGYLTHGNPYQALDQACLFAGWKVGVAGAADGFLPAGELARLAWAPS